MFEKEAYEYREKGKRDGYYLVTQEMEQEALDYIIDETFKDAAEFGYNKAKVEVEESYRESLCNSELNLASVTEQLEELERANEWHYPSKGEYPEECEDVLCYCRGLGIKFCCVGHPIVGGDDKVRWWANNKIEELRVVAWKEITLPKESE